MASLCPHLGWEPTPLKAEPSEHSRDATLGAAPRGGAGSAAAQPAPASRPPSAHCLPSLNGPTVIRSRSPAARALRYAPRFLGALTTDGCYTRRVLLGHEQCVTHRNCATHSQDAPARGPLGRAPDCLPWVPVAVRGRMGRCLGAHRVSGAALCPGCAFTPVPAGSALPSHTVPGSLSDLSGSEHPPGPQQRECSVVSIPLPSALPSRRGESVSGVIVLGPAPRGRTSCGGSGATGSPMQFPPGLRQLSEDRS